MGLPSVPSNMARGWPLVAIMLGARLNQVGKYMLAIMADPSWQIRASRGGDDFGDKHNRLFSLPSEMSTQLLLMTNLKLCWNWLAQ